MSNAEVSKKDDKWKKGKYLKKELEWKVQEKTRHLVKEDKQ